MKKNQIKITIYLLMVLILTGSITGCSDSVTNSNGTNGNENISFSSILSQTKEPTTIQITEAKALITEMEIENSNSQSQHVRIAPFVINFNTNGNISDILAAYIPVDSYRKVKFKIHKPEDNESIPDPEFNQGVRSSVIIKGTYNGTPFVYKTKKSIPITINFNGNVSIGNNKKNVTMLIGHLQWFKYLGNEIDPNNPSNENKIDDNVRDSFRDIFLDDDRNGIPDGK